MMLKSILLLVIMAIFSFDCLRGKNTISKEVSFFEIPEQVVQMESSWDGSEKDLSKIFSTVDSQQQEIALNEHWINLFLGLWGPCLLLGFLTYLTEERHYTYAQYRRDEDRDSYESS